MFRESMDKLIEDLSSNDSMVRQRAREQLVLLGGQDVTRALVGELVDPRRHVRWEASKALTEIADPVAAFGLMHTLDDGDEDVRWVAGEGLIALGKVGLITVLSGLEQRADSSCFCLGAHHVLHDLNKMCGCGEAIAPVLEALEGAEPAVMVPLEAMKALITLKTEN